jgi:hypothetical protein
MADPTGSPLRLLRVGDPISHWQAAGFATTGDLIRIGNTTIVCDPTAGSGIQAVAIGGLTQPVDGLPIDPNEVVCAPELPHPNHITRIDHLVMLSPAVERTSQALMLAGLERRRIRTFDVNGEARRQDFFWLGDVILELAGPAEPQGDGSAMLWGLALESDTFEASVDAFGAHISTPKPAVQPGRQIATIKTRELGISVPLVVMSSHRT